MHQLKMLSMFAVCSEWMGNLGRLWSMLAVTEFAHKVLRLSWMYTHQFGKMLLYSYIWQCTTMQTLIHILYFALNAMYSAPHPPPPFYLWLVGDILHSWFCPTNTHLTSDWCSEVARYTKHILFLIVTFWACYYIQYNMINTLWTVLWVTNPSLRNS
jgi:hypothetical protein